MNSASWFEDARYGLFVHYGLFSLLERGEWVMNRESIPREEYAALASSFTAENFDADAICDLAVQAGMRYIVLTTMHHDGFRLYDSKLSSFNSVTACGRDLTREIIEAARHRGLKVGLYHSLNNWMDQPDAVAALENPADYETFIHNTLERIRELVTLYNPIDVLWYDGWWPFDAAGWQSEKMNAMVREIQPHILFNGRNGLPGDFATPEGHLGAPTPWRPWEACITLNNNWGFHRGDEEWKTPAQAIDMLITCAQGKGNLLLNIGPRGDGSVPQASVQVIREVGRWLEQNGAAIYDTELFTWDLRERGAHRSDWNHHGPLTCKGNDLYQFVRRWPGNQLVIGGLECQVQSVTNLATGESYAFEQQNGRLVVSGLPDEPPALCPVLRLSCDHPPVIYQCAGMRVPRVDHPHYDPCESDIAT